ncbi:MAG: glycoside hydrolase family 2 protein [Parasporobacterium sp.]|nr:glycoside hydrolase family 2 protein [Parasporobacterium sp.]
MSLQRFSLNGEWNMKMTEWQEMVPAQVPGDIYSDLLRAGKMQDPYFRDQELQALPLSEKEYLYEKRFDLPAGILTKDCLLLRFEGIDTLADICLNGTHVAAVHNMHRTWEFPVKELLKEQGNLLQVLFHSPVRYIRKRYQEKVLDGTSDAMRGFPYLRKAHCMFGWDWGARLPGGGLFREVCIVVFDRARIESVYLIQRHEAGKVFLTPQAELQVLKNGLPEEGEEITAEITVTDPRGQILSQSRAGLQSTDQQGHVLWTLPECMIEKPQLWYPAGYGGQPLYTVEVTLKVGGRFLDTWKRRIGLRTMEIARKKDTYGESFAHCVNGIEIFAMGADYIPEDHLIARTSPGRTRRLLEDARMAHFNCIRVWGGGYYPEDWFYDICDELGLLVWQDFMFACAVYDLTEDFENNISRELIDNIRRLRHHASLGLWCGNNEMEQFVDQGEWVNSPKEKSDYVKMYEYLFPKIVRQYDPQTFYWPASPSSGGNFDLPNDENRGDVHYWDVWHGGKPFTEYRKFHFRYLSEFGFQAFPAMKTIEAFTLPEDRNVYSYVMEKHQRNASANGKIAGYMAQTYLYPNSFEMFVYASQLLQAQAIRYGAEHFRRWRGRCMGTVIWQLNDCWPVVSWSSIDYYGRWKALHYYARRFFAPVLLSCEEEGILTRDSNPNAEHYDVKKSVRFNVSNETLEEKEVRVHWFLADSQGQIKREQQEATRVSPLSAKWFRKWDLPEADPYEDHVCYRLEAEDCSSEGSVLFCPPKYYHFQDPKLHWRLEGDEIVVTAAAFAKDIEIQNASEDLVLSDNYFDLEPGERRIRILRGIPEGIRLRSTFDIR